MKFTVHTTLLVFGLTAMMTTGCKKPKPPAPTPPPPKTEAAKTPDAPPKAVVNSFTASPETVVQGSPATLRWSVSNASDVSIDQGIGVMTGNTGSHDVTPSVDTSYTLVAKGPGGIDSKTITVHVRAADRPIAPPPEVKPSTRTFNEAVTQDVKDAYYDYDKYEVRDDARSALTRDADALKAILGFYGTGNVIVEGHCDERGSGEYNLALGDRRAQSAVEFLKTLGLSSERMKSVSYGKDRPQCTDPAEDCYQKNRRVHFSPQ